MIHRYLTVRPEGKGEIEINRSQFIAYVRRVESQEEAVAFIQEIKKKHWDATHNCSAYIAGEHDQFQKMDDDGEPGGTAGKPIMEVIKRNGLKDTAIVVTRYFGGIKLGAGGLIRAYGKAASEGLKCTGIVERILIEKHSFSFDYTFLGKLENELQARGIDIINIDYLEQVTITVGIEKERLHEVQKIFQNYTGGKAVWTPGEQVYIEKEYAGKVADDDPLS
jgi:uncharacterized YigZ family protein